MFLRAAMCLTSKTAGLCLKNKGNITNSQKPLFTLFDEIFINTFGIIILFMKGIFRITGQKVQGVGYRPFLLGKFEDYNLSGKARNLPNRREVEVIVWGEKKDIKALYRHLGRKNAKPKDAEVSRISALKLSENNQSDHYLTLRHGQAVMAGQFYKAVEVQTDSNKKLGEMDKKLGELGRGVGALAHGQNVMNKGIGSLRQGQNVMNKKLGELKKLGALDSIGKKLDTLISVVKARGM